MQQPLRQLLVHPLLPPLATRARGVSALRMPCASPSRAGGRVSGVVRVVLDDAAIITHCMHSCCPSPWHMTQMSQASCHTREGGGG
jgi:hypothetical protein